ncbi:MAG: TonB-dependent receptor, partial [Planctomycetaceae bacterium]|nr:TonB-dependent receptor [Planctomycetaceae bacterium]
KQDFYTELKLRIDEQSRIEFNYLNTQINALELPGIVYDLDNSTNNQFNLRYVIQEDPEGVEQFVLQTWSSQTVYSGDSTSSSKQRTFFEDFLTPTTPGREVVSTFGSGSLRTHGARALATFGEIDDRTLTIGADWRAYTQRYEELDFTSTGDLAFDGNIYGIPKSTQNDFGLLAHSVLPASDLWTFTFGGRLDFVFSSVNADDSIVTAINPPDSPIYYPGLEERTHFLGMSYLTASREVTDSLKINGGVAFAMRPPSLPELYQDEPYEPVYRFGNSYTDGLSTLNPERNFQIDLGFTETRESVQFGGRAFHSNINDYIMAVPSSIYVIDPSALTGTGLGRDFSQFPISAREDITSGFPNADGAAAGYRYVNLDRVEIWGTDGFLEVQPRDGMSMRGTISYVQGINHSPVQTTYYDDPTPISLGSSEPLPYIYPLNGTITTRIFDDETDRWSVSLITRLVATQNRVAKSVAELPTDGFIVLSLRSYVRPTKNWKLSLSLENLLDNNYRQHDSLAIVAPNGMPTFLQEPGFSVILGSEITF